MSETERLATWADTVAARFARPRPGLSVRPGAPRSIGSPQRAAEILDGRFRIGGLRVETRGLSLWDVLPDAPEATREAHGFAWIDDLAAAPTEAAEALARDWTADWVRRFGEGTGQGWSAELAGRRALRLVHHAEALHGLPLAACLGRHVAFLARRAPSAQPGLPRLEAFAGLFHAALALDADDAAEDALARIEAEADALVGREGGLASRNPETLGRVLLLLGWTAETAAAHGRPAGGRLAAALARGVPVLRALTQPDGCLPRFHGGGASPGLADAALALAGRNRAAPPAMAMGYARVRHGRTGLVLDAAPPAGEDAHAGTLAVELTVGRRPLVVNCGSGRRFGQRWARAARATASHSALSLDGFSSSRFGRDGHDPADAPLDVRATREETETGTRIDARHDGYVPTHGLRHERSVELRRDGRHLVGEDALIADAPTARRRFDRVRRTGPVRFAIRFHLDPAVEPSLDMGGRAVSLLLPSGALWVFRVASREVRLSLEPSIALPDAGLKPLPTSQVVLFSSADEYATRVAWHLAAVPGAEALPRDTAS